MTTNQVAEQIEKALRKKPLMRVRTAREFRELIPCGRNISDEQALDGLRLVRGRRKARIRTCHDTGVVTIQAKWQ